MSEERCPSCLMADFESLVKACSFCGIAGCDLCIYDGDLMYNAPTCCAEARAMHEAWWRLPTSERAGYPRGACADEVGAPEARRILSEMLARAS